MLLTSQRCPQELRHVLLMYGNIYCTHVASRGVGGYSGFQVTGMIELGQKSKQKKSLRPSIIPQKIHRPKINPQQGAIAMGHGLLTPKHPMQNFRALINDITRQITTTEKNSHIYAGGTRTTTTFGIFG